MTTRAELSSFQQTGDACSSGSRTEHASGNVSIVRLAPVPIPFADDFPDDIERLATFSADSSLPTHASPQCLSACRGH